MKYIVLILLVFGVLIFSNVHGQNSSFTKTVITNNVKQIQTYSSDSLLVNVKVFEYNEDTKSYDLFQSISYDKNGRVISLYSYYGKKKNEKGDLMFDQIVVDIDEEGKPERVFFTNEFKLFRNYIYNKKKRRYKRMRLK